MESSSRQFDDENESESDQQAPTIGTTANPSSQQSTSSTSSGRPESVSETGFSSSFTSLRPIRSLSVDDLVSVDETSGSQPNFSSLRGRPSSHASTRPVAPRTAPGSREYVGPLFQQRDNSRITVFGVELTTKDEESDVTLQSSESDPLSPNQHLPLQFQHQLQLHSLIPLNQTQYQGSTPSVSRGRSITLPPLIFNSAGAMPPSPHLVLDPFGFSSGSSSSPSSASQTTHSTPSPPIGSDPTSPLPHLTDLLPLHNPYPFKRNERETLNSESDPKRQRHDLAPPFFPHSAAQASMFASQLQAHMQYVLQHQLLQQPSQYISALNLSSPLLAQRPSSSNYAWIHPQYYHQTAPLSRSLSDSVPTTSRAPPSFARSSSAVGSNLISQTSSSTSTSSASSMENPGGGSSTPRRMSTPLITVRWMKHYNELKQYKQQFGHCNASRKIDQWKSLGHWVRQQRRKRKQGKLSPSQIELLDQLGFEWDRSHYTYSKTTTMKEAKEEPDPEVKDSKNSKEEEDPPGIK